MPRFFSLWEVSWSLLLMSMGCAAKQRDEMQRCKTGHLHIGIINTNPACTTVIFFEILLVWRSGAVDLTVTITSREFSTILKFNNHLKSRHCYK